MTGDFRLQKKILHRVVALFSVISLCLSFAEFPFLYANAALDEVFSSIYALVFDENGEAVPDSDEFSVRISGYIPEGSRAEAYPVSIEVEDSDILAAYDITIYDQDGKEYQPGENRLKVEISTPKVRNAIESDADFFVAYHMADEKSEPSECIEAKPSDDKFVSFDAEHFSIYAVGTHLTHTYNFYNGSELYDTQILSAGEYLNEPPTPDRGAGGNFTGWYTAPAGGSQYTAFGSDNIEPALSANIVTNIYAHFDTEFHVRFLDEFWTTVIHTDTYSSDGAEILTDSVRELYPAHDGMALLGWTTDPDSYDVEYDFFIDGEDVVLYPIYDLACVVSFDAGEAEYIYPRQVAVGGELGELPEPAMAGYTFNGWVDEEGNEYDEYSLIFEDITLYADWTPHMVKYTVRYWQENPQDEFEYYIVTEDTEVHYALAGEWVDFEAPADKYEGFTLSDLVPIESTFIEGDGTAVVNVYYDRQEYTIYFYSDSMVNSYIYVPDPNGNYGYWPGGTVTLYSTAAAYKAGRGTQRAIVAGYYNINATTVGNGGPYYYYNVMAPRYYKVEFSPDIDLENRYTYTQIWDYQEFRDYRISAKYGADISYLWPAAETWLTAPKEGYIVSGIGSMPLGGGKFYIYPPGAFGEYTYLADYYLENEDGDDFEFDHSDIFVFDTDSVVTNSYNYYDIPGFTYSFGPELGEEPTDLGEGQYLWEFYYERATYNLAFINEGYDDVIVPYKFGTDISGAGYTPPNPPGKEDYIFAGWYTNEFNYNLGVKYDFTGKTMPSHNFSLIAKWERPGCTVTITDGAGNVLRKTTVPYGTVMSYPSDIEPQRDGYIFVGWELESGEPFDFTLPIYKSLVINAEWIADGEPRTVTYDPGIGIGEPYDDPFSYAVGEKVVMPEVFPEWEAPDGYSGFIAWTHNGNNYYTSNTFIMPEDSVTLVAKWAAKREALLTLDYGYDSKTKDVNFPGDGLIPNSPYTLDTPTRPGYTFLGWNTKPDGTGTMYGAGDSIHVDTLNPESNILYAQWEEAGVTLTVTNTVLNSPEGLSKPFNYTYIVTNPEGGIVGSGSFSLISGQSRSINVGYGNTVTVTQADYRDERYKTRYEVSGATYEAYVYTDTLTDAQTVDFFNEYEPVAITGVNSIFTPYILAAVLGILVLFALGFIRYRRGEELN